MQWSATARLHDRPHGMSVKKISLEGWGKFCVEVSETKRLHRTKRKLVFSEGCAALTFGPFCQEKGRKKK
jgi:hypothetical protein